MGWIDAITLNRELVRDAGQTDLAAIVSGSSIDSAFWAQSVDEMKRDILRDDGRVAIVSLAEEQPLGNFLGTVNAWTEIKRLIPAPSQGVSLWNMVFGKGKRLSPFTQALGNRKAAFPTPLRGSRSGKYLRTGDLATLYSNSWLRHLRDRGFHGALIKWGDEAIIPSSEWGAAGHDFSDVDLIRFVWKTEPTDVLAREKEWFVINDESGLIERLIPRQTLDSLTAALRRFEHGRYSTAVNLGSIAVSYRFLRLAAQIFEEFPGGRFSADWDPFVMFLLLGSGDLPDSPAVQTGLAQAEARCPGLTAKIKELQSSIRHHLGRPLRVGFVDFGEAFWVDFGLHSTLRQCLASLTSDGAAGETTRSFFSIPQQRDANGNILVRSMVPAEARITNSVIVDSTIADRESVVHGGVVVGSRHNRLSMSAGGASLFSAVRDLQFEGENGITFRSVAAALRIPEGGRHTSLFLNETPIPLVSNESIRAYDDAEYGNPILGNSLSFEAAGNRASEVPPRQLEENWLAAWRDLKL
ncbi:MAG TPA: hypothetical protein VM120_26145 [Bryobacteraceae bacterium]|nr:hypothetical protein [Bryobacteraceae bacterium]